MKRVLAVVFCLGMLATSYASVARILSMGKHDAFFMDETSIFRNPANLSIYPNMLMGSFGEYRILPEDTASGPGQYPALTRTNRDPRNAFFGGILSYSLNQNANQGNQYPMLSVGAVFNRYDPMLDLLNPSKYSSTLPRDTFVDPVGKVDFMIGYAFPNGGMIGAGTFLAFQQVMKGQDTAAYESNLVKGNVGVNWPVAKSMDLEASLGGSLLTFIGQDSSRQRKVVVADNDIGIQADLRLFSALTTLNGDFVPHLGVKYQELMQGKKVALDVAGGLGLNVNIDKGFFWAGLEGLYGQVDYSTRTDTSSSSIGGRVGFGIERNVFFDWFVIRVGVMKSIWYVSQGTNKGQWAQNPEHDSDDDVAGLGFGINIENRLKFDILVAEDIQNTFTNLVSGPQHHIFTRWDATFSF